MHVKDCSLIPEQIYLVLATVPLHELPAVQTVAGARHLVKGDAWPFQASLLTPNLPGAELT